MAVTHGLYRSIVNVDVCIEFKLLEAKVPLLFSGTVGFPPHMEGRYICTVKNKINTNRIVSPFH